MSDELFLPNNIDPTARAEAGNGSKEEIEKTTQHMTAVLADERNIWVILDNVVDYRNRKEVLGDRFSQNPADVDNLAKWEKAFDDILIASPDQLTSLPPMHNQSLDSLSLSMMSAEKYNVKLMGLLPLEKRITYLSREFSMLEDLALTGHDKYLNDCLQEMIFRFRNSVIDDKDFDDMVVLGGSEVMRGIMLLYLAVENAHSGDIDTVDAIINDMQATPGIAKFLKRQLDEIRQDAGDRSIAPALSKSHLDTFMGSDKDAISKEQIEAVDFGITIGLQPDVALKIFQEDMGGGRLLTALEVATSGGRTIIKQDHRDSTYNQHRRQIESAQLGYTDNIFAPSLVYGALNTAYRPDQGNGYGPVVLHIKDKPGISYTIGDSMPSDTSLHETTALRRVNRDDAEIAAVYNEARGERMGGVRGNWYPTNTAYIEAQIPGVSYDDIDHVSLVMYGGLDDATPEEVTAVAKAVLDRGMRVSVEFQSWVKPLRDYIEKTSADKDYAAQVRRRIDPTGKLWHMIDVQIVDPIPSKLTKEEITEVYGAQGIPVIFHDIPQLSTVHHSAA